MIKIRNEEAADYRTVEELTRKPFITYTSQGAPSTILCMSCVPTRTFSRNWIL